VGTFICKNFPQVAKPLLKSDKQREQSLSLFLLKFACKISKNIANGVKNVGMIASRQKKTRNYLIE
jgi:hypothetical protein